jgi:hypothetical protein
METQDVGIPAYCSTYALNTYVRTVKAKYRRLKALFERIFLIFLYSTDLNVCIHVGGKN